MSVVKGVLASLAVLGFCLPQPLLAAALNGSPAPVTTDVTLRDGGTLIGQVVDPQGAPLAKVAVSLRDQTQVVGTAGTDAQGYFTFRGLQSGVYQIVAAEGYGAYRLWTPQTAPPSSQQGALVVSGDGAVPGNFGGACWNFITNPWVIIGLVAVGIAVPVAINAADEPNSP